MKKGVKWAVLTAGDSWTIVLFVIRSGKRESVKGTLRCFCGGFGTSDGAGLWAEVSGYPTPRPGSYEEDIFLAQACHEDVSKERPGEYGERCKISRQLWNKNHAAACRGLRLYLSYSRLPTVRFRKKIRLRRIYALSLQFGLCDVRRVGRTAVPKAYLLCQRRLLWLQPKIGCAAITILAAGIYTGERLSIRNIRKHSPNSGWINRYYKSDEKGDKKWHSETISATRRDL